MATHSSTLAWKIPWPEDPGGLQSMGHKESGMTERLSSSNGVFWCRVSWPNGDILCFPHFSLSCPYFSCSYHLLKTVFLSEICVGRAMISQQSFSQYDWNITVTI